MRTFLLTLAVAVLAFGSVAASACEPTTSRATATAGPFYIINELCPLSLDCIGAFWIYAESNGIEGLQRQDEIQDDTCEGQIAGDTIIL